MNATRRKQIEKIMDSVSDLKERIEMLRDEEQDYSDNMPENMQDSEKHERAEEVVASLEEAIDSIESAISSLEEAKE